MIRWLWPGLTGAALITIAGLAQTIIAAAPEVVTVDTIRVTAAQAAGVNGAGANGAGVNGAGVNGAGANGAGANGVVLGWNELGQRPGPQAADRRHLLIRHSAAGWSLANLSPTKRIDARTSRYDTLYLKRWELRPGDQIEINGSRLRIDDVAAPDRLTWTQTDSGRQGRWLAPALRYDPDAPLVLPAADCGAAVPGADPLLESVRRLLRGQEPDERRLVSFGGRVDCPDRWRLSAPPEPGPAPTSGMAGAPSNPASAAPALAVSAPPASTLSPATSSQATLSAAALPHLAYVLAFDRRLYLAPGRAEARIGVGRQGETPQPLETRPLLLDAPETGHITRLVIGRTHYRVEDAPDVLTLTPVSGQDVWPRPPKARVGDGSSAPANPANPAPPASPADVSAGHPAHPPYPAAPPDAADAADARPPPAAATRVLAWVGAGDRLPEWIAANTDWLAVVPPLLTLLGLLLGAGLSGAPEGSNAAPRWERSLRMARRALALGGAGALIGATIAVTWGRGQPPLEWLVVLALAAWGWATLCLGLERRLEGLAGGLWLGVTLLFGIGVLVQLQLAAGALTLRAAGFPARQLQVLSGFGAVVAVVATMPAAGLRREIERFASASISLLAGASPRRGPPGGSGSGRGGSRAHGRGDNRPSRWLAFGKFVVPVGGLVAVCGLQIALGWEGGVLGFQPAELSKLVIVLLGGYLAVAWFEQVDLGPSAFLARPLGVLWRPMLLFLALVLGVAIVLISVHDFSPILILSLLLPALIWKFGDPVARRDNPAHRPARWLAILCWLGLLAGTGALFAAAAAGVLPEWLPARARFLVWANPTAYPESGGQVAMALRLAGAGGWHGAGPWFGSNGAVMDLPAVEDDFIATFLLNRFGADVGLATMAVQLACLALLFTIARRMSDLAHRKEAQADYRERRVATLIGFTVYGGAWLTLAHWAIAWGNALALLPVMGQPMTWIAAGNSHLLCVGLPVPLIALLGAWYERMVRGERGRK